MQAVICPSLLMVVIFDKSDNGVLCQLLAEPRLTDGVLTNLDGPN